MTEELVSNPYAQWDEIVDQMVPVGTLQIYDWIEENEPRSKDTNVNRASSATYCQKRRWYQKRGVDGIPITPRKRINFYTGDIVEMVILSYISKACVGNGKLYSEIDFGDPIAEINVNGKILYTYKQKTLTTKIDDLKITCHADGFGKRNTDGKWELIEIKSSNSFSFKSFKLEGPKDYLKQAHTIMASEECKSLGIVNTRYWYEKKETGQIWDEVILFSEDIWKQTKDEFLLVMKEEEPPAPFSLVEEMTGRSPNKKTTGRMIANFPCSYCPFIEPCHGPFIKEYKENQWGEKKPVFVFERRVT